MLCERCDVGPQTPPLGGRGNRSMRVDPAETRTWPGGNKANRRSCLVHDGRPCQATGIFSQWTRFFLRYLSDYLFSVPEWQNTGFSLWSIQDSTKPLKIKNRFLKIQKLLSLCWVKIQFWYMYWCQASNLVICFTPPTSLSSQPYVRCLDLLRQFWLSWYFPVRLQSELLKSPMLLTLELRTGNKGKMDGT